MEPPRRRVTTRLQHICDIQSVDGRLHLRIDAPDDRAPVLVPRDRNTDLDPVVAGLHVPAPPAPQDRVSLFHEEPVAGVFQRGRVVSAPSVEGPQSHLVAAVGHVVEQPPVAAAGIGRHEQEEVGPDLDAPAVVHRSQLQVTYAGVGRIARVNFDVEPPDDLLIRPGASERMPAGEGRALVNLHTHNLRVQGSCDSSKRDDEGVDGSHRASREIGDGGSSRVSASESGADGFAATRPPHPCM